MSDAERRRELRKRFLRAIYELAAGSTSQFVYWANVAPMLGWDAENSDHLHEALGYADYLVGMPYDPDGTIPSQLSRWLIDRGLSQR